MDPCSSGGGNEKEGDEKSDQPERVEAVSEEVDRREPEENKEKRNWPTEEALKKREKREVPMEVPLEKINERREEPASQLADGDVGADVKRRPCTHCHICTPEPINFKVETQTGYLIQEISPLKFPINFNNFTAEELAALENSVTNKTQWSVPIAPDQVVMNFMSCSIVLCKKNRDFETELSMAFYKLALKVSLEKVTSHSSVFEWDGGVHSRIRQMLHLFTELVVCKLKQDCQLQRPDAFFIYRIFHKVMQPSAFYYTKNENQREIFPPSLTNGVYCNSKNSLMRPWLDELWNHFGLQGGFQLVSQRLDQPISIGSVQMVFEPFERCYEMFTPEMKRLEQSAQGEELVEHISGRILALQIAEKVWAFVKSLTFEKISKDVLSEHKTEHLRAIFKSLKEVWIKEFDGHNPERERRLKETDILRFRTYLFLIQGGRFSEKLAALSEFNACLCHGPRISSHVEQSLSQAEQVQFIKENKLLEVMLQGNLHQHQYVERVERIVRYMIKAECLTATDLDFIWYSSSGKHEAIEQNIYSLFLKLAWDLNMTQLDHLFELFQEKWTSAADAKEREKLLIFLAKLAEDDREGAMAAKAVQMLWSLAMRSGFPNELTEQALQAHAKILESSGVDRSDVKYKWIKRCVTNVVNDDCALPAIKQFKVLLCQFTDHSIRGSLVAPFTSQTFHRDDVIHQLQSELNIIEQIVKSIVAVSQDSKYRLATPAPSSSADVDALSLVDQHLYGRLDLLSFVLHHGNTIGLENEQAVTLWKHLVLDGSPSMKNIFLDWFGKLLHDETLSQHIGRQFFEEHVLRLSPKTISPVGMNCFETLFNSVNISENKLISATMTNEMTVLDRELIGLDFVWRVLVCVQNEVVAEQAKVLLKKLFGLMRQAAILKGTGPYVDELIDECWQRARTRRDTIGNLLKKSELNSEKSTDDDQPADSDDDLKFIKENVFCLSRVMSLMLNYVAECDQTFPHERTQLPLQGAEYGWCITLKVYVHEAERITLAGSRIEPFDCSTHSNVTVRSLKQTLAGRIKPLLGGVNANLLFKYEINGLNLDSEKDSLSLNALSLSTSEQIVVKTCRGDDVPHYFNPSSLENSSSSSSYSPSCVDEPNFEAEQNLPSVTLANDRDRVQFLIELLDTALKIDAKPLALTLHNLLLLIPVCEPLQSDLTTKCHELVSLAESDPAGAVAALENTFSFGQSQAMCWYLLRVAFAVLFPTKLSSIVYAQDDLASTILGAPLGFQRNFLLAGGLRFCLRLLSTERAHLSGFSKQLREACISRTLSIYYVLTTTLAFYWTTVSNSDAQLFNRLNKLRFLSQEPALRKLAEIVSKNVEDRPSCVQLELPQMDAVKTLINIVSKDIESTSRLNCEVRDRFECSLKVLKLVLLVNGQLVEKLRREQFWRQFIINCSLNCPLPALRYTFTDSFLELVERADSKTLPVFLVQLLFTTPIQPTSTQTDAFFDLLRRLLNFMSRERLPLNNADSLLDNELKQIDKIDCDFQEKSILTVSEEFLCGHLRVASELLAFESPQRRLAIGFRESTSLVNKLLSRFLFTESYMYLTMATSKKVFPQLKRPICSSRQSKNAALNLIVEICRDLPEALLTIDETLTTLFFNDINRVTMNEFSPGSQSWDWELPVGPVNETGYVGLKNAGATCYMNSVLQQFFALPRLRYELLHCDQSFSDKYWSPPGTADSEKTASSTAVVSTNDKEYHMALFRETQEVFVNLALSRNSFYEPLGFWGTFRMNGEQINVKEQHDALEFFNQLVESIDEALKTLGHPSVTEQLFGGLFDDQKVCKDCPHRYTKDEKFMSLNVDIRNQNNLQESLEQYVKGDLLEGDNAYYCEKCDKKVDTVKRMCIKKLPPILVVQLKRFGFDFERFCSVKYNDYFEFPRQLNMEPYTVRGVARAEAGSSDGADASSEPSADGGDDDDDDDANQSTVYRLIGVVLHSGQTNTGHYYSVILDKRTGKWIKLEDQSARECPFDDDEEMKNLCFAGENNEPPAHVSDVGVTRRRIGNRKKWWGAYILFYERVDSNDSQKVSGSDEESNKLQLDLTKIPKVLFDRVSLENLRFAHLRHFYSAEFFTFFHDLCASQLLLIRQNSCELSDELKIKVSQALSERLIPFVINTVLRCSENIRGDLHQWTQLIYELLKCCPLARKTFFELTFMKHSVVLKEFFFLSTSVPVKEAFVEMLLAFMQFSDHRALTGNEQGASSFLHYIFNLRRLEEPLANRYYSTNVPGVCQQFFDFFIKYIDLGPKYASHLLEIDGLKPFINLLTVHRLSTTTDIRQTIVIIGRLMVYFDFSKSFQVSDKERAPLKNPLSQKPLVQDSDIAEIANEKLWLRLFEEITLAPADVLKIFIYCSWENSNVSKFTLDLFIEQLKTCSTVQETRALMEMFLRYIQDCRDSWQQARVKYGFETDSSLLAQLVRKRFDRKQYVMLKMLMRMIGQPQSAFQMILQSDEGRRRLSDWRHSFCTALKVACEPALPRNNAWDPASNEDNGFHLQRTRSAINLLHRLTSYTDSDELVDEYADGDAEPSDGDDDRRAASADGTLIEYVSESQPRRHSSGAAETCAAATPYAPAGAYPASSYPTSSYPASSYPTSSYTTSSPPSYEESVKSAAVPNTGGRPTANVAPIATQPCSSQEPVQADDVSPRSDQVDHPEKADLEKEGHLDTSDGTTEINKLKISEDDSSGQQ